MSTKVLITNTSLGVLANAKDASLSFESDVGDLREMAIAGAQVDWDGVDTFNGRITAWASMTGGRFSAVKGSTISLDVSSGSYLWNFGVTGWRYLKFIYTSNAVTTGQITIFAAGKKNG